MAGEGDLYVCHILLQQYVVRGQGGNQKADCFLQRFIMIGENETDAAAGVGTAGGRTEKLEILSYGIRGYYFGPDCSAQRAGIRQRGKKRHTF